MEFESGVQSHNHRWLLVEEPHGEGIREKREPPVDGRRAIVVSIRAIRPQDGFSRIQVKLHPGKPGAMVATLPGFKNTLALLMASDRLALLQSQDTNTSRRERTKLQNEQRV